MRLLTITVLRRLRQAAQKGKAGWPTVFSSQLVALGPAVEYVMVGQMVEQAACLVGAENRGEAWVPVSSLQQAPITQLLPLGLTVKVSPPCDSTG